MHIPTCEIKKLDIIPFSEPPDFSPNYDAEKWLLSPEGYQQYRYILGTRCQSPLICIGINPSTAEPNRLDPTLQSVSRIAKSAGFDGFIMFNVYAQRATRPDDLDREIDERLHLENMRAFKYILSSFSKSPSIWAAWGTIIGKRPYLKECLKDMALIGDSFNARWLFADKLLKNGHPHHPLYLRKDCLLSPFDILGYLDGLG
ncbi:DUF1643 domain-containing protein [Clostridiaceae bacterium OttesenSCG-928-D20]|nr:DUF1643 domain-containing protein [Clostridiaceae bacterium OttesenSCG-928-D20]